MLSFTKAARSLGRLAAPLKACSVLVTPLATAATAASPYKRDPLPQPVLPKVSKDELAEVVHRVATEAANKPAVRTPTVPLFREPGATNSKPAASRAQQARYDAAATDSAILAATQRANLEALFAPVVVAPGSFPTSTPEKPIYFNDDLALKFRVVDAVLSELGAEIGSSRLNTINSVNDIVAELTARVARKEAFAARDREAEKMPENVTFMSSTKRKEHRK